MEARNTKTADGLDLTYYLAGEGARHLVIASAPGMSVRFWVPIIRRLADEYRILAFDYRGASAGHRALRPAEAYFQRCVDDVEHLLDLEGIERAQFLAWCSGTSLVAHLHKRRPRLVRSLGTVGVSRSESNERSSFASTIADLCDLVTADAASLPRMLGMMKKVGLYREPRFFEELCAKGDRPGDPEFERFAGSELGKQPFLLFGDDVALANYLALFREFRDNDLAFANTSVPIVALDAACGPEQFPLLTCADRMAKEVRGLLARDAAARHGGSALTEDHHAGR